MKLVRIVGNCKQPALSAVITGQFNVHIALRIRDSQNHSIVGKFTVLVNQTEVFQTRDHTAFVLVVDYALHTCLVGLLWRIGGPFLGP